MLIGAVVVHQPEFFVPVRELTKNDLRGGDAGETSGKSTDDFVGELVGELRTCASVGRAAIDFADDGLVGGLGRRRATRRSRLQ